MLTNITSPCSFYLFYFTHPIPPTHIYIPSNLMPSITPQMSPILFTLSFWAMGRFTTVELPVMVAAAPCSFRPEAAAAPAPSPDDIGGGPEGGGRAAGVPWGITPEGGGMTGGGIPGGGPSGGGRGTPM